MGVPQESGWHSMLRRETVDATLSSPSHCGHTGSKTVQTLSFSPEEKFVSTCVSFEPQRAQLPWIGKLDTVAMSLSMSDGWSLDWIMSQTTP